MPDKILYSVPITQWFWEWGDERQAVAWMNGYTLAFRGEIEAALARLPRGDWPPADALLLVLAAMRENWPLAATQSGLLDALASSVGQAADLALCDEVCDGLSEVHAIGRKLVGVHEVGAEIFRMIYEAANSKAGRSYGPGVHTTDEVRAFLAQLEPPRDDDFLAALRRGLGFLKNGLGAVSEIGVRLRLKTSLEQLPQPAEVELPRGLAVRQLLARLRDDSENGGLARLAQSVLAMLQLPRPTSTFDDTPSGGISDIANRGPLDRLLLSELAHDDLTLATRVAIGEALYLRRESTPPHPPRLRHVLLDVGVRMWGVPRLYAVATALALAAATEPELSVEVFTGDDKRCTPANVTTSEGLTDLMSRLHTTAHLGSALPRLLSDHRDPASDEPTELVLVTCEDAWHDADFQQQLASLEMGQYFLVLVERDGRLTLRRQTPAGATTLRQARLDLDTILRPSVTHPPAPLDPVGVDTLPAIFHARPFPLLLSHDVKLRRAWHLLDRGVFSLTTDGRLTLWTDAKLGAMQLATGLPNHRILAATLAEDHKTVRLIVGTLSPLGMRAIVVSPDNQVSQPVTLKCPTATNIYDVVIYHNVAFVLEAKGRVTVVGLTTGEILATKELGVVMQRFGRFVRTSAWHALHWDGAKIELPALGAEMRGGAKLAAAVPVEGSQQPALLYGDWTVAHADEIRHLPLTGQCSAVVTVSRNGARLYVHGTKLSEPRLFDWRACTATVFRGSFEQQMEPEIWQFAKPRNHWTRTSGLVWDGENLGLLNKRGTAFRINSNCLGLEGSYTPPAGAKRWLWKPMKHPGLQGIALSRIATDDGSDIFFDGRGLLHFRSSNRALPEFTVVVAPNHYAGWSADGRVWGDEYFSGYHPIRVSLVDPQVNTSQRKLADGKITVDRIRQIEARALERLRSGTPRDRLRPVDIDEIQRQLFSPFLAALK